MREACGGETDKHRVDGKYGQGTTEGWPTFPLWGFGFLHGHMLRLIQSVTVRNGWKPAIPDFILVAWASDEGPVRSG